MNRKLGFLSLLLTALLWGSTGVWIRILNSNLTVYQQLYLRNIAGVIICFCILFLGHVFQTLHRKKLPVLELCILTLIVPIAIIFNAIAILRLKIGVATFMYYAGEILLSYLFGRIFFRERLSLLKWSSLVIAIIGLSCFMYPFSWSLINWSIGWGLASGALGAVANIFRKKLSGSIDRFFLVFLGLLGGVILSGIMLAVLKEPTPFTLQLPSVIWITGIGFGVLLVVSNYLVFTGFNNFDLGLGGLVLSAELFFATIFGYLFLHETPLPNELIGGILIFLAVLLSNL